MQSDSHAQNEQCVEITEAILKNELYRNSKLLTFGVFESRSYLVVGPNHFKLENRDLDFVFYGHLPHDADATAKNMEEAKTNPRVQTYKKTCKHEEIAIAVSMAELFNKDMYLFCDVETDNKRHIFYFNAHCKTLIEIIPPRFQVEPDAVNVYYWAGGFKLMRVDDSF